MVVKCYILYKLIFVDEILNTLPLMQYLNLMKPIQRISSIAIKLFFFTICIQAQIIQPSNSSDWHLSGLSEVVHPTKIQNVAEVYNLAGDGITDDAVKIQNALNLAKPGTVLFFPAGNYLLENYLIVPSNIVLRGENANLTKFKFRLAGLANPDVNCINITNYQYGNFVPAISGYTKGSSSIEVEDASGFSIGSYGEIQQENDAAVMYTQQSWNVSWADNAVGQLFKIVDIQANTLFISPPLNISFQNMLNPVIRPTQLKENVGIENLAIERLDIGEGNHIIFTNTANCWVWNIESKKTVKSHIWAFNSLHLQIQDSYFHQSYNYGGGGHGYGVTLGAHVTHCLVENNIFKTLRHAMMVKEGANGNVFAYNYSIDPTWTNFFSIPADISVHGHYPYMNLFEGNIVQKISCTDFWGPAGPGNTFFRNRIETLNLSIEDYSHEQNLIGNEMTNFINGVFIEFTVNNTLVHGNNENGNISWSTDINSQMLPNSYYLNQFWMDYDFPSIGPEFALNEGSNPAKDRYDNQAINSCYTGRSKKYEDYVFPDDFAEMVDNQILTSSSVSVLNNSSVQLKAAKRLQFNSGFKVEEGATFKAAIATCTN